MSINSQLNTITASHHGNGRMIELPDPAVYLPGPVKTAVDTYLTAAKQQHERPGADPAEQNDLEQACAIAWADLLSAMRDHHDEILTHAAEGRRSAARRLHELVDELEDAAVDYVAHSVIEAFPCRPQIEHQARTKVPGHMELGIGLDGTSDSPGLRQALAALNDA